MNRRVFDNSVSVEDIAQLGRLVETLAVRYPAVPQVAIEHIVLDIHERFEGSRVRTFIPILIEKAARGDLDAFAQSELLEQTVRRPLLNMELIENEPLTGQMTQAEYS